MNNKVEKKDRRNMFGNCLKNLYEKMFGNNYRKFLSFEKSTLDF